MEALMNTPERLLLIRHGETEINLVTQLEKEGIIHPQRDEILMRPDYMQRLTPKGHEQAKLARAWLIANNLDPATFDELYMTTHYRGMETADEIGGGELNWLPDFRLVERDWGEYGSIPKELRAELFPFIESRRKIDSLHTRYTGGESIIDKSYHIRDWLGTLYREQIGKKVMAVMHGESMWSTRFVIERMLPDEYHDLDASKTERIENCTILDYNPVNPDDPEEISPSLGAGWLRIINPVDPDKSPHGGEWMRLKGKRRLNSDEIKSFVNRVPLLIGAVELPKSG